MADSSMGIHRGREFFESFKEIRRRSRLMSAQFSERISPRLIPVDSANRMKDAKLAVARAFKYDSICRHSSSLNRRYLPKP